VARHKCLLSGMDRIIFLKAAETNEDTKRPLPDQRHTGVLCEHAIGTGRSGPSHACAIRCLPSKRQPRLATSLRAEIHRVCGFSRSPWWASIPSTMPCTLSCSFANRLKSRRYC